MSAAGARMFKRMEEIRVIKMPAKNHSSEWETHALP
jgi:hypothetical protein